MNEIIKIDVSDKAIRQEKELLTYKLKEFMEENITDENELISMLIDMLTVKK